MKRKGNAKQGSIPRVEEQRKNQTHDICSPKQANGLQCSDLCWRCVGFCVDLGCCPCGSSPWGNNRGDDIASPLKSLSPLPNVLLKVYR